MTHAYNFSSKIEHDIITRERYSVSVSKTPEKLRHPIPLILIRIILHYVLHCPGSNDGKLFRLLCNEALKNRMEKL